MRYVSDLYNRDGIIIDEADQNGFYPFVKDCCVNELTKCCPEYNNDDLGIFVVSDSSQQPYIRSYFKSIESTQYRGMASSKLFRCTPVNGLASFLSIELKTDSPALTLLAKQDEEMRTDEYLRQLITNGLMKAAMILRIFIDYVSDEQYRVVLDISFLDNTEKKSNYGE